jgi:hypothetical protein
MLGRRRAGTTGTPSTTTYSHVIPGMVKDAATTVADLILTGTQKGPGTVVPDPSANKTASNGLQSDASIKEVKDERPAQ